MKGFDSALLQTKAFNTHYVFESRQKGENKKNKKHKKPADLSPERFQSLHGGEDVSRSNKAMMAYVPFKFKGRRKLKQNITKKLEKGFFCGHG